MLFCVELVRVEVAGELAEWGLLGAELPCGVVLCSEDALPDTITALFGAWLLLLSVEFDAIGAET